jgi:hypothetical protein
MISPDEALSDAIRRVQGQAAGLIDLVVVRPVDVPGFVANAIVGDGNAFRAVSAVAKALVRIENAPIGETMLCAACSRSLLPGSAYAIAVALPAVDEPNQAIAMAVCAECAVTPQGIREKAVGALMAIWPTARLITITDPKGGHA